MSVNEHGEGTSAPKRKTILALVDDEGAETLELTVSKNLISDLKDFINPKGGDN